MHRTPDQIRQSLGRKADAFKKVFLSPDGETVMKALRDEFDKDYLHVPNDSHSTAYNCGRRDVVTYINQMLRYENDDQ